MIDLLFCFLPWIIFFFQLKRKNRVKKNKNDSRNMENFESDKMVNILHLFFQALDGMPILETM